MPKKAAAAPKKEVRHLVPKPAKAEKRRWGAIPPPAMDSGEAFDGHAMLQEEGDNDLAAALFVALRRASGRVRFLIGDVAPGPEKAWQGGEIPELPGADRLLGPGFAKLSDEEVGEACLALARASVERRRPRTVRSFSRTAALLLPERADAALTAATAMEVTGDRAQTEMWLRRAVMGARRIGDWGLYAESYLRLSRLMLDAGREPAAQAALLKASRTARRKALPQIRAESHLLAAQMELRRAEHSPEERAGRLCESAAAHLAKADRVWAGGVGIPEQLAGERHRANALFLAAFPRHESSAERRDSLWAALPEMAAEGRNEVLRLLEAAASDTGDSQGLIRAQRHLRR